MFVCSSSTAILLCTKVGRRKDSRLDRHSSHHGLKTLSEAHPDVDFTVAHVDPVLTKDGSVLPGLGDAGDRLFGTHTVMGEEEEDEMLLHPSKRKRTMSNASEFQ